MCFQFQVRLETSNLRPAVEASFRIQTRGMEALFSFVFSLWPPPLLQKSSGIIVWQLDWRNGRTCLSGCLQTRPLCCRPHHHSCRAVDSHHRKAPFRSVDQHSPDHPYLHSWDSSLQIYATIHHICIQARTLYGARLARVHGENDKWYCWTNPCVVNSFS